MDRDGTPIRAVQVSRKDAAAIRALVFDQADWTSFPFDDEVTQADACDILNVPNRDRALLLPYREREAWSAWLFDRTMLIGIAREVVTSAELCARHYLVPKTGHVDLRNAGLDVDRFGYARSTALDRFADHLAH